MKKRKKIRGIILALLLLFLALVVDLTISYQYLIVRTHTLASKKLSTQINVAVISDLHGNSFGENNARLVDKLRKEAPDFIILAGDFVDSEETLAETLTLIAELVELAPVYYGLGNQEEAYVFNAGIDQEVLIADLEAAGAVVVEESYIDCTVNGQNLRIGGLYDYAFANDGEVAEGSTDADRMDDDVYDFLTTFQDTDAYMIMISHRPDSFIFGAASSTWEIDLVVSGHTHGGQVVLPILGGLWVPDQGWFPTYDSGYFQMDSLDMVITSGLGSRIEKLPRLNNPPEIMLVEIVPE